MMVGKQWVKILGMEMGTGQFKPFSGTFYSLGLSAVVGEGRDNTNWRAGRAGGPCFQLKNVNFGGLHI